MKKLLGTFLLVVWAGSVASFALAGPSSRFDETTQTCRKFEMYDSLMNESYNLFIDLCKVCHQRDNEKGATFLYTESKTPEAWNRVFFKRYSKCAKDGTWDKYDEEDLRKINDFLYRFGAGTFDPNDADDAYC